MAIWLCQSPKEKTEYLRISSYIQRIYGPKKVRERTAGNAVDKVQDAAGAAKISDDDKIRLQLYVDVKHFILQIEKVILI